MIQGNDIIWNGNLMKECHNQLLFKTTGTGMLEVVCTQCGTTVIQYQSHPTLEITRTRIWPFYLFRTGKKGVRDAKGKR